MKNTYLNQEQVLMDAFGFNLRDLHANREGRITKAHFKKVTERYFKQYKQIGSFFLLVFLISLIVLIVDSAYSARTGHVFTLAGSVALFTLSQSMIFIIIALVPWLYFLWITPGRRVATIQGIVIVDVLPNRAVVKIGNLQLRAHRDALLTLKHMSPYVIHYLPGSKVIVSIEAMES